MSTARLLRPPAAALLLAAWLPGAACNETPTVPDPASSNEFAAERESMVAQQIEARGIVDPRVLAAMRRVPRHRFMHPRFGRAAYLDQAQTIGHGQTISQPYVVAFMTAALELTGDEKVLEIGTGSGYQAAILGELAREVFTIEIVEPLGKRAADTLAALDYDNVSCRVGDGYGGWPEEAPFDAICVTAAPDHVPEPLIDQLAVGGRLIAPVGDEVQELVLLRRTESGIERESVLPVRFVPMTGLAEEQDG